MDSNLPKPPGVGFGGSGRYAPGRGLLLGFAPVSRFAFGPCEGGVLELWGVFGGRLNLSRSAAFSVLSASTSTRKASTRASNTLIKASFSGGERVARSSMDGAMVRLTHKLPHGATQIYTKAPSRRLAPPVGTSAFRSPGRLSNYPYFIHPHYDNVTELVDFSQYALTLPGIWQVSFDQIVYHFYMLTYLLHCLE